LSIFGRFAVAGHLKLHCPDEQQSALLAKPTCTI